MSTARSKHSRRNTIIGAVITVAVVVAVFGFMLPKVANYDKVWATLGALGPLETAFIAVGSILTMLTFWWMNMAALPGLGFHQSAYSTQSSYAVANTVPAGGPISLGLTYEILHSYRFSTDSIVLMVGVGGIWNVFGKFIIPVLAVAFLLISGDHSSGIMTTALIGIAALVVALGLMALVLWKESLARRIGNLVGRIVSWVLKLIHKPPITTLGDQAVTFRTHTIGLVKHRWQILTLTAVANNLAYYIVLLVALRGVGVTSAEVDWAETFAAFAFGRLASAIPITPGAVGTAEAAYIGLLVAAGAPNAETVAAVLLFRACTYLFPIPVGGVTYLLWRRDVKTGKATRAHV
ncbi:MAG: lysylphosphatidylglycerol synthase transmembrane domain-containing protein [Actinomycetota bacterium]